MQAINTKNRAQLKLKVCLMFMIAGIFSSSVFSFFAYDLLNNWLVRGRGSGEGLFAFPNGIAVNGTGYVYVTDTDNHRVQVFTATGQFVATWGSDGSGPGQFQFPRGIAINGAGNVYVTDSVNHRVQVYTSTGQFVTAWSIDVEADKIAINSSGDVFVMGWRTQVFTSGGVPVTNLTLPGMGIAINGSGYIFRAGTAIVSVHTPAGEEITEWGESGSDAGQLSGINDIAINATGYVYVADGYNNRVQVFMQDGTFVTCWGTEGFLPEQFSYPYAIATAPATGMVYVVDLRNSRVQAFTATGQFVTAWGFNGDTLAILYPSLAVVSMVVSVLVAWYRRRLLRTIS